MVLPGGFSYGDYLRCGAIARFAPVMAAVVDGARGGLPVLGICNGFQVLCESHLLPGALIRNDHRKFNCVDQELVVENTSTAWTSGYSDGPAHRRTAEERRGRLRRRRRDAGPARGRGPGGRALRRRQPERVVPRASPAITNERGNVVGLMPHPEHAVEDADRTVDRRAGVLHLGAHVDVASRRMTETVKDAEATPDVEQP